MNFGGIPNKNQIGTAKTALIHIWGQSNSSDIVLISGNLPSQYQSVMPSAWATGDGNITTYFHAGYNTVSGDSTGTKYGVSTSLAYKLSNTYGKRTIISNAGVLNTSLCTPGIGAGSWNINDPSSLYTRAVTTFAVPAINRIGGAVEQMVIWIQGENDAGDATAATDYYQNMVDLINKSRQSIANGGLGDPNLKWVIVELRSTHNTYYQVIRDTEANIVANIPNTYYFDTSFVVLQNDNIHWSPQSFIDGGNYLADLVTTLLTF